MVVRQEVKILKQQTPYKIFNQECRTLEDSNRVVGGVGGWGGLSRLTGSLNRFNNVHKDQTRKDNDSRCDTHIVSNKLVSRKWIVCKTKEEKNPPPSRIMFILTELFNERPKRHLDLKVKRPYLQVLT